MPAFGFMHTVINIVMAGEHTQVADRTADLCMTAAALHSPQSHPTGGPLLMNSKRFFFVF